MPEQVSNVTEIFYSYDDEDQNLQERLVKHLSILEKKKVITSWNKRNIGAGKDWEQETKTHLDTAHIILLLISSSFISSENCYDIEMKRAMQRHERKEARVIPIILRPTDWQQSPFGSLTPLPKDGKPVTNWENIDDAFVEIAIEIGNTVRELRSDRSTEFTKSEDFATYKKVYYEEALATLEQDENLDALKYYEKGNILRDLMCYEEVIRLDPTFADAYRGIGNVHYILKQYDKAEAAFERAINFNRKDTYAVYSSSITSYKLEKYKESYTKYQQAVELDSTITQSYPDKELALEETESYKETIKVSKAIESTSRKNIGIIGISIPIVLLFGGILSGSHGISDSISSYFYNVTGYVLVGSLCAIAVLLVSHRGYAPLDDIISTLAGVCAIGVVLFPTPPDVGATQGQTTIGLAHASFASSFFLILALMSIVLFRRTDQESPTRRKQQRNTIYLICGIVILACLVQIGRAH